MIIPLQYNIFVLSFGALQGALLGFFLLRNKKDNPASLFLLLYLLTLLLQVAMKIASKVWLMHHLGFLYLLSYLLPFLYGPLLYLFLKHSTQDKARLSGSLLHFVPFFLAVLLEILDTQPLWANSVVWWSAPIGSIASLGAYHLAALRILSQIGQSEDHPLVAFRTDWLRKLTLRSLFTTVTLTLALLLMFFQYPRYTEIRWLFAAATVFIYWITYSLLTHPELFHSSTGQASTQNKAALPKYSSSTLTPSEIERIMAEIDQLMQQKRPYLDPELTLDDLAELVKTNRHNLSQVLNGHLKKKFPDFLNTYRVEAAKTMLTNQKYEHLKIAAIAYDSGFNSLSTFNAVFKKMTGQKPSEFRGI